MARDIDTPRVVGILGDALTGSISPQLHNALFQRMGLPFCYLPFQVDAAHLAQLIETMLVMDVEGLNITAPHKLAATHLCHQLDPLAARIGTINTIVVRNKRAIGYNTDAAGFLAALKHEWKITPRGKRVVLLGAGGAAAAVADAVLYRGASTLAICNRNARRRRALATHLKAMFPTHTITTHDLTPTTLARVGRNTDLVIQATSAPRTGRGALRWPKNLTDPQWVMDLRYGPGTNLFLDGAGTAGSRTTHGLEMLITQAAQSFQLWTHRRPDLAFMRKCARNILKKEVKRHP
jgi:shikimate dehydrogenase